MNRVAMLRAGYGAFALAFLGLAGTVALGGGFLFLALAASLVGAMCLILSRDQFPRWAGASFLAYVVLTLIAFLAATPVTINKGGSYFLNDSPSQLFERVRDLLVLVFPLILAATAVAATWEREWPPRLLAFGALIAFLAFAILDATLVPGGAATATTQNRILQLVGLAAAILGAASVSWAATRPDEYR